MRLHSRILRRCLDSHLAKFPCSCNLTNLRFADDVILVAQSRSDIAKMLHHLQKSAAKFGLKIHFGKTKVMTWNSLAHSRPSVSVGGESVTILDEAASERYLGRKLAFQSCQEVEIANRLAAGWAAFTKHRSELCCKQYRLSDRLKLFEATVSPAVLYGCTTWALTKTLERKLQVTRRRMLRFILRIFRCTVEGVEEEWVPYMHRARRKIERLSFELGVKDWVECHRRRKWQFAGKLARQTDNRWSHLLLDWQPNLGHGRSRGHPCTRWADPLESFVGGAWIDIAADYNRWDFLEEGFVTHDGQFLGPGVAQDESSNDSA